MVSQEKQPEELGKQKTVAGKSKQRRRRKGMTLDDRPLLEPNAAGIDIGAREIFVAVPADRDENPVRVLATSETAWLTLSWTRLTVAAAPVVKTFTADLEEMAKWLVSCRVTTVAMESTGVYWIPLYDVLERHGVTLCLVNARNMKNVPGRRTDWRTTSADAWHYLSGDKDTVAASPQGQPVATVSALGGIAESGIPARRRCGRSTVADAAPHGSGADGCPALARGAAQWRPYPGQG